jgi:hypothetical protein
MFKTFLNFAVTFFNVYGSWILIGFIIIAAIIYIYLYDRKKKIPKKISIILVTFFIILPSILYLFFEFINPHYLGYGYTIKKSQEVFIKENNLWLIDDQITSGAIDIGFFSPNYRLQIVNLDNGKKAETKMSSNSDDFAKEKRTIENEHRKQYYIYPNSISDSLQKTIVELKTLKGLRKGLFDNNNHRLNENLFFLDGEFLLFDKSSQVFITLSYETLDKINFILRCISTEGKLIWETKQAKLKVGNFFNKKPILEKSFFYQDNIVYYFTGFAFSLKTNNGEVNWLTKL